MYCSVGCCTCHCNCVSTSRSSGTLVASSCVCGSICVCLGEREQHTPQGTADRRRQTGHREGRPATRKWQERVCRDATAERAVNLMKHCSCVTELEKGKKKKKKKAWGRRVEQKIQQERPETPSHDTASVAKSGALWRKIAFWGGANRNRDYFFFSEAGCAGLCWAVHSCGGVRGIGEESERRRSTALT